MRVDVSHDVTLRTTANQASREFRIVRHSNVLFLQGKRTPPCNGGTECISYDARMSNLGATHRLPPRRVGALACARVLVRFLSLFVEIVDGTVSERR